MKARDCTHSSKLPHEISGGTSFRSVGFQQGCQLSRIERESHAWTLFLTLSRQACKISRMNTKHPAKHVKSHPSRFFFFACHFFLKLKWMHTLTDANAKWSAKYYYFFHVLVTHAKQFSKVDSPVSSQHISLLSIELVSLIFWYFYMENKERVREIIDDSVHEEK